MAWRKTAEPPLLTHWSCCSIVLSHWYDVKVKACRHSELSTYSKQWSMLSNESECQRIGVKILNITYIETTENSIDQFVEISVCSNPLYANLPRGYWDIKSLGLIYVRSKYDIHGGICPSWFNLQADTAEQCCWETRYTTFALSICCPI